MSYEPLQPGFLDQVFNSTIGLPQQFIWRIWRAMEDDKVDLFSEKGILDAALIPVAGMFDTHEHDVMPDYMAEQLGMADKGESGFGSQLSAAILSDPLTYMTGGLTAIGRLGKIATNARKAPVLKKVLREAADKKKQDLNEYFRALTPEKYSAHIDDAIAEASKLTTTKGKRQAAYLKKMKPQFDGAALRAERLHQRNALKARGPNAPRPFGRAPKAPGLKLSAAVKSTSDRQIAIGLPVLSRWGAKYDVPRWEGYGSWWKLFKDGINTHGTAAAKALLLNKIVDAPGIGTVLRNTTAPFRHFRAGFKIGHEAQVAMRRGEALGGEQVAGNKAWISSDGAAHEVLAIHKATEKLGGSTELIDSVTAAYADAIKVGNMTHEDAFKAALNTFGIGKDSESGRILLGRLLGQGRKNTKFPDWKAGSSIGKRKIKEIIENAVDKHGKASREHQLGGGTIAPVATEQKAIANIFETERAEKLNTSIALISEGAFNKGQSFKHVLNKVFMGGTGLKAGDKAYADFLSHVARDNDQLERLTKDLYTKLSKLANGEHNLTQKDISTLVTKIIELDALPGEISASVKAAQINPQGSKRIMKSLERFLMRQRSSMTTMEKVLKRGNIKTSDQRNALIKAFDDEIFPFLEREGRTVNKKGRAELIGSLSRRLVNTTEEVIDYTPQELKRLEGVNNRHVINRLALELPLSGRQLARQKKGEDVVPTVALGNIQGRQAGTLSDTELNGALSELDDLGQRSLTPTEIRAAAKEMDHLQDFKNKYNITTDEAIHLLHSQKQGQAQRQRLVPRTKYSPASLWKANKTRWSSKDAVAEAERYGFRLELQSRVNPRSGHSHDFYEFVPTKVSESQLRLMMLKDTGGKTRVFGGYRTYGAAMHDLRDLLLRNPDYVKAHGPGFLPVKQPIKVPQSAVDGLKFNLGNKGVATLRGETRVFDDAVLPGSLLPDLERLTKLKQRRELPRNHRLYDTEIKGTPRTEVTDIGLPRGSEELSILLRKEGLELDESEIGDWAIQYARGRLLIREVQKAIGRGAKVDERILADLESHIAASGGLVRNMMESHLPAAFTESLDIARRISGASFDAAQRAGVWLPGSPVGYLARFFTKGARARIGKVMGNLEREEGDLLTRLGVRQAQYFKRSWDEMTIDDLNDVTAELREAMNETGASPKLAAYHKALDLEMEKAGVGISGLKAKLPWTKKRFETDPYLGLLQRLGVAQQDKNLESYFNNMLAASTGKNGDSLMLGGKIVSVIDNTGNVHGIDRKVYKSRSTKRSKVGEEVTLSEETETIDFIPKSFMIELSDGTTHVVENNMLNETGFGLLELGSDFELGEITADMLPGFKPSPGSSFARASMRSDLLNKMAQAPLDNAQSLELLGKNVVFGSRNNITATVKAAARVHEVTIPAIRAFDSINYGLKAFQTIFRLPFHIANLSSGVFQAHLAGATSKNLAASYFDTARLLFGNQDFAKRMSMVTDMLDTGAEASSLGYVNVLKGNKSLLQDAVRAHGSGELHRYLKSSGGYDKLDDIDAFEHLVIPLQDGTELDLMEFLQTAGEMQLYGTFASSLTRGSRTLSDNLMRIKMQTLEPTFGGRLLNAPKRLMEKMANVAETSEVMNRTATALALVRDGHPIRRAIEITKEAHVPYEKLTPFERNIMKRISVYYTFPRHYMPWAWSRFAEDPSKLAAIASFIRDQNILSTVEGKPNLVLGDYRVDLGRLNANLEASGMLAAFADRLAMPAAEALVPGIDGTHPRQLRQVYSDGGLTGVGGVTSLFWGNNILPVPDRDPPKNSPWEEAATIIWPLKMAAQLAGKIPSKEEKSPYVQYTELEWWLTNNVTPVSTGARKVRHQHELIRAQMAYRRQLNKLKLRIAATEDPEKRERYTGHIKELAVGLRQIASEMERKE